MNVSYKNSTEGDPHLLTLPDCEEGCPLERFIEMTRSIIPEDHDSECKKDPTKDQPDLHIPSNNSLIGMVSLKAWRPGQLPHFTRLLRRPCMGSRFKKKEITLQSLRCNSGDSRAYLSSLRDETRSRGVTWNEMYHSPLIGNRKTYLEDTGRKPHCPTTSRQCNARQPTRALLQNL
uniref:(California timema) hypothetical protein n=1 Tax=Timema californicum TaxID=61474 RepID=A0A7R9J808_TIMCA|nr:unnamed protein product [Timema californicum]